MTKPATSAWSAGSSSARVPYSDGEDAAAVDVADQQHRQAGRAREAHVGEVGGAQVDLGRAAGALADDDVVARAQVGERVEHRLAQRRA